MLNFHPDWPYRGAPMLAALAADGIYRSQFETGTSNGGLTAYAGGDRRNWESQLFGGAYDEAAAELRPKYGALNYRQRSTGASPRFGSANLRLAASVLSRCSFCFPDSVYRPTRFGTAERMSLARLADAHDGDPLDDYIEAHVHGAIRLASDVEAVVLDPCFQGIEIETLARQLPCALEWHPGFRVPVDELRRQAEYRGPRYVQLAACVARDDVLTPEAVGEAARSRRHDPQDLKKVWHYLARFGDLSRQVA